MSSCILALYNTLIDWPRYLELYFDLYEIKRNPIPSFWQLEFHKQSQSEYLLFLAVKNFDQVLDQVLELTFESSLEL